MTTTPEGLPAWLHVGAEVGTYSNANGGTHPKLAVVERFTKTQVVLSDGQRFSTRHVTPHTDALDRDEGGTWGWTVYLVPRDCDDWRRVVAKANVNARTAVARGAVEKWARNPSDESARAAIAALQATLTTTKEPQP